jgi:hypothetical protein
MSVVLDPSGVVTILSGITGPVESDLFSVPQAETYTFTASKTGTFQTLLFQLQSIRGYAEVTVATWDAVSNPSISFALDPTMAYRLNCSSAILISVGSAAVTVTGPDQPFVSAVPALDVEQTSSMPNPPTGKLRIFANQTPMLNCIDSHGNPAILAGGLAPRALVDGGTY